MPNDESNALHLMGDILNKVIDAEIASAKAIVELKSAVRESNETLEEIRGHFTNGFRSEIKKHITTELKNHSNENETQQHEICESLRSINTKLDTVVETLTKPWFWIKLVGTIIVSLGVIIAAVSKMLIQT